MHIQKAQVPKKVLNSVAAKYPRADLTEFLSGSDAGQKVYIVRLKTTDNQKVQLVLAADGKLLAEQMAIPEKSAPPAVRASLSTSQYSGAKVLSVEKITELDKPSTYEFVVDEHGQQHALLYSPRGDLQKDTAAKPAAK
jgi:hypothetical protein